MTKPYRKNSRRENCLLSSPRKRIITRYTKGDQEGDDDRVFHPIWKRGMQETIKSRPTIETNRNGYPISEPKRLSNSCIYFATCRPRLIISE